MTARSAPYDLSGLTAWTQRNEWHAALAKRIEGHAAKACAGAGIAAANIESVLGGYGVSSLWGAAFEDLLATYPPDGCNIAEDYLRRHGWKESVATREYTSGLRGPALSPSLRQRRPGSVHGRVGLISLRSGVMPWYRVSPATCFRCSARLWPSMHQRSASPRAGRTFTQYSA